MPIESAADPGITEALALVRRLTGGGLYVKTGVLLLPRSWLGREKEVAARLNLGHFDYQSWRVARLRPDERFLRYSAERLLGELDAICAERHEAQHLLLASLDLPVSALSGEERRKFWTFLHHGFTKRPRALLTAFPQAAEELLPWDAELIQWKDQGRLCTWNL
jgi:tRNA nucleotidyltransferase/poly(A) polymerase